MPDVAQELVGNSIGPYDILGLIGEGGMGVVYRGVHRALDQPVAVKALSTAITVNREMRDRFLQEARIQAKLTHPNIVNLLNFIEEAGSFYLVMEFIDGETVENLIRRVGLVPPERAIAISLQVLGALGFAHEKGIIHRDVKPSNIMITKSDVAKITDFGIAKIMGAKRQTATGVRPGTLWYMSPEQVKGENLDARADIYSFGVTLYQMVTGKVPFDADSEYGIMRAHVELQPILPRDVYPYIPDRLEKAILRCLAKKPADRYQTAKQMAEDLQGEEIYSLAAQQREAKSASVDVPLLSAIIDKGLSYRFQLGVGAGLLVAVFLVVWSVGILFDQRSVGERGSVNRPPPEKGGEPLVDTAPGPGWVTVGGDKPERISAEGPKPLAIPNATGMEKKKVAKEDVKARHKNEEVIRDYITTAWSYIEHGQYQEAISELEKARSLDPDNKEVVAMLGKAHQAWNTEKRLRR